jgi:hypothetical protein
MIQVGKNITQLNDALNSVSFDRVYKGLTNPDSEMARQLQLLRQLQSIDINQYRKQKTNLPYLVCAHFYPNFRKKENFVYTEYFIIDLDHLHQFDCSVTDLKAKLQTDERILMLFVSPSNDGLKVVFKLSERITDSGYYTMFYKIFASRFATQYQLQGIVDLKTSDVSRCCFMSFDPEVYYNPEATSIVAGAYTQEQDLNVLDFLKKEVKEAEKEAKEAFNTAEIFSIPMSNHTILTDSVLQEIKLRINPNMRVKAMKNHYQPEELEQVLTDLKLFLEEHLIQLVVANPISYGKQLLLAAKSKKAEINLFYGKRGFSVVKTTKTGTCSELTELAHTIISQFLAK